MARGEKVHGRLRAPETEYADIAVRVRAFNGMPADRHEDEFLATLAHELRNPLSPMTNALALLRRGERPGAERARDLLDRQLRHVAELAAPMVDAKRQSLTWSLPEGDAPIPVEGDARVAHEGEPALRVIRQAPPDIALLDIGMPGLDGYELARRLRADPVTRRVRRVAITGWGQATDREAANRAGFDLHLVKPVDPDALMKVLERLRP